jgi:hypothetical protein
MSYKKCGVKWNYVAKNMVMIFFGYKTNKKQKDKKKRQKLFFKEESSGISKRPSGGNA